VKLGYNTNGFPHHRLEDTLRILADLGYESVAIALDYHALDPFHPNLPSELAKVKALLERLQLSCVVETGARFLLDPWRKHQPTLLSRDPTERDKRLDFLTRTVKIARELQADAVSLWSGTPLEQEPVEALFQRLADGCRVLADEAARLAVRLAFEPEPGMFIDTLAKFRLLDERVSHPAFGLTIDIGHLHCMGEVPIASYLTTWRHRLWNVHIEDMRRGVHEHLFFGEGEIAFEPILRTLREIYAGGAHIELSRHGHNAVETARRARTFLLSQAS
jgi:sugar phosphate isomerase/epimerase